MTKQAHILHRPRGKTLGLLELIAIALGGMVGGGIFTVLGISVSMIGVYTPIAIAIGGLIAMLAAYSYVKLGVYYKDEGATYSFFKRIYPHSPFSASLIGWWIIFGYISTVALYAYTFASYAISDFSFADNEWIRKLIASCIILIFMFINIWSVKGMGKLEDVLVYTKLVILAIISFVLIDSSNTTLPVLIETNANIPFLSILIIASVTFVAYEGFQLVINAMNEMESPTKNIPRAIYSAIALAVFIYVIIALGAILAIPFEDIVQHKEYALAAGAEAAIGPWGANLVVFCALLATSSAISGTLFGASRQMAVIAKDGFFPKILAQRNHHIPTYAIMSMAFFAISLIFIGDLQLILEFSSVTFLFVCLLMAVANYKIRLLTHSSSVITLVAIISLLFSTLVIIYYELVYQPQQLLFIGGLYIALTVGAWVYTRKFH